MLANFDGSNAQIQWQRFCDLLWYESDLGIWLDVSRMAIGQADLDALAPRFDLAFAAMAALEGGAIANPDEQRQVGHYWLRTPELAPDAATTAHINAEVERIETKQVTRLHSRYTETTLADFSVSSFPNRCQRKP